VDGPKYPDIEVQLSGEDGNAYFILGRVQRALRKGGVNQGEIDAFMSESSNGSYNHLLQTCMKWVTVT
jgi:hypothetical protein